MSDQTTQNSKSTQNNELEIYEVKTDLKIKNIEIRRPSYTLNGSNNLE